MFMKKILLVDDVKLLLEIQKKFLASSSVNIITANDGKEALEKARTERPDLIIMDKFMPVMDGLDCCRAIKADPAIARIPVIMASNATREEDISQYLDAGCSDVLAKPLDGRVFLNAIKKHIPDIERRGVRIPVELEMSILANNYIYDARTENISVNGVFAVTDIKADVNDDVRLSFRLPESEVPTEVKGRVVWERRASGGHGVGIEFMEVIGQGISLLRVNELKSFINSRFSSAVRPDLKLR